MGFHLAEKVGLLTEPLVGSGDCLIDIRRHADDLRSFDNDPMVFGVSPPQFFMMRFVGGNLRL